jgi:hypothetical protein
LESKAAALRFGSQQDTLDYIAHRFVSFIALINSFPSSIYILTLFNCVTHLSVGSCETPRALRNGPNAGMSYKR